MTDRHFALASLAWLALAFALLQAAPVAAAKEPPKGAA